MNTASPYSWSPPSTISSPGVKILEVSEVKDCQGGILSKHPVHLFCLENAVMIGETKKTLRHIMILKIPRIPSLLFIIIYHSLQYVHLIEQEISFMIYSHSSYDFDNGIHLLLIKRLIVEHSKRLPCECVGVPNVSLSCIRTCTCICMFLYLYLYVFVLVLYLFLYL